MNRFAVIAGISMISFLAGFAGYFMVGGFAFYALKIVSNTESVMAMMSGMAGSSMGVLALIMWERLTRN